jgi:hypothetical protein
MPNDQLTTKRCSNCGTSKPLDAFPRQESSYLGVHAHCRDCQNAAARERLRQEKAGLRIPRSLHGPHEPLPDSKVCTKCGLDKLLAAYGKQPGGRFGLHPRCKECRRDDVRAHYNENRERILAQQKSSVVKREWRRKTERLRRYGVTHEQYAAAVAAQNGRCAACGDECRLVLDHDHRTGVPRGLLCSACNVALGYLRDDPDRVRGALAYLENPPGLPS